MGGKKKGQRAPAARPRKRAQRGSPLRWLGVLGAVIAVAALRVLPGSGAPALVPQAGQPAPDFTVKTFDGEKVELSKLRGKVVLVNFWATWCPPCRAEMPGFEDVWRDRKDAGFVVVGLSADETSGRSVAAFLRDRGISYPVGMASASARAAYGGVVALPMSFLVDADGVVQRTVMGVYDEGLLRQDVSRLLASR